METLGAGVGILAMLIPAALVIFVIIIAILTLLAINNLHKIPQMQQSLENIEKYLKFLTKYEKERLIKEGFITSESDQESRL
jgi:predicted Holliday junction resolvase-like endonuclease